MATKKLIVSSSPHVGSELSTQKIMLHVIIALSFTLIAGVVIYGIYPLVVVALAVASAVLAEMLYNLIAKKPNTVKDLSAIVTGMILGLNLPPTIPLYVPVVGSVFAIMVVKMLFGGLGKNFANPAATARIFLLLSWSGKMTKYIPPVDYSQGFFKAFFTGFVDSNVTQATAGMVTSATPLGSIKDAAQTGILPDNIDLLDLFLGKIGGSIGEVCTLAIILALVYLLIFKIIDWKIPLTYIAFSALFALIFYKSAAFILPTLMTGGLMFAAVFMLTDYSTSPNTRLGSVIFAAGAAFMTLLIRRWGGFPEGASIAVLFMNLLVPIIDRLTLPKPYGYVRPVKKKGGVENVKN